MSTTSDPPSSAHGRPVRRGGGAGGEGFLAAVIYSGLSVSAALIFFLVTLAGDYSWVARIGGAAWVFALCMIILMPTVTPWIRERLNR